MSKYCLFTIVGLTIAASAIAQEDQIKPDTWVAVDDLNRRVLGNAECGPPRDDRFVGIFYHLWHGVYTTTGPWNITSILEQYPEAINDRNHPAWGPEQHFHHWERPLFGYYTSTDEWVYRKHAQMLVDAGVDVVIFDYTNGFTSTHHNLAQAWSAVRAEGNPTPKMVFMCPFWADSSAVVVEQAYANVYSQGLYQDLWFYWDGKPLIIAEPWYVESPERDFFTFRKPIPEYNEGPSGPYQWGWLEIYPQHEFYDGAGETEEMTAGIAQNMCNGWLGPFSSSDGQGRSWHNDHKDDFAGSADYGLNFAEQWRRCLKLDPKFVFVTGWNEWTAQRLYDDGRIEFWDAFTQEYSRDIEPMTGGHRDNYYYQLANYVRQYKGARPVPTSGPPTTIAIDGSFADWDDITPVYRDTIGDTAHRDHGGYGSEYYVNTTGRNDLKEAKVAYDNDNVYFYVRCEDDLTPYTDPAWMMLYIDSDHRPSTGWYGYDYMVNYPVDSTTSTTVKQNAGGWNWTAVGQVSYKAHHNELELAIPRAMIGQDGAAVSFDFHWADNAQPVDDIMSFTCYGDSAPNDRFKYRFTTDTTPPAAIPQFSVTRTGENEVTLSWTGPNDPDFTGVLIRYRQDHYPVDPSDGVWICDQFTQPGVAGQYVFESCNIEDEQRYYFAAFSHDGAGNYASEAAVVYKPLWLPGDIDGDDDVDMEDFGRFQLCLTGPFVPQDDPLCQEALLDGDDDVDKDDLNILHNCLSGADVSGDPDCAD